MNDLKFAILGLGEAGSHFAKDLLKLGVEVNGYDPLPISNLPKGLTLYANAIDAVHGVDIILSANLSAVSVSLAEELAPHLTGEQFYCEMNTSGPEKKKQIEAILHDSKVKVVDLAIMAPVPPLGIFTPLLAAGPNALEFFSRIQSLDLAITVLPNSAIGEAATRKLLRSIVYKGIAAVVCEAMEAGIAFDMEAYIKGQISSLIGGKEELIDRFVEGSRTHAKRRKDEMEAVIGMLESKGIDPVVTYGTRNNLQKLIS